jgi:hypothetical protein
MMKYQPVTPGSSRKAGAHSVCSADGAVEFTLVPTQRGLLVERTQVRSRNARVVQSIVFRDDEAFQRWCDADSVRFDYPLLYMKVKRDGDHMFRRR